MQPQKIVAEPDTPAVAAICPTLTITPTTGECSSPTTAPADAASGRGNIEAFAKLCREYDTWLAIEGLLPLSADELIHEPLTPQQRGWLSRFIARWEAEEALHKHWTTRFVPLPGFLPVDGWTLMTSEPDAPRYARVDYAARNADFDVLLDVSPYEGSFRWTQDRFAWFVANKFPARRTIAPWSNATIDAAMVQGGAA